jgi:hypothetical protein
MEKRMIAGTFTRLTIGAALFTALVFAQGPRGFGPGPGGPERWGRGGRPGGVAPVTGSPFTALETRTSTSTLADGNTITHTTTINLSRDGQGRTRTEETFAPETATGRPARTRVTIVDPVAGQRHELDSLAKTDFVTTIRVRNGSTTGATTTTTGPANRLGRNGNQPTAEHLELGVQAINGVAATGRRDTQTLPVGRVGNSQPITITRETWMSESLKRPIKIVTTDPRRGTEDMELTNINQSEPDPSLFTVPAGYTSKTGRGPGPVIRGPAPR